MVNGLRFSRCRACVRCSPVRRACRRYGRARPPVVLEVDEDILGAAFLPVLDDVLKSFDGAVLLVVAVGEIADRADLHVLNDFARLDLAGGHLGGRVGELNGVHGFSTDNFGVLRRFGVRDGSTAVFFGQIVLQAGLGVLQGGVEGVKRLRLEVEVGAGADCGIIRVGRG